MSISNEDLLTLLKSVDSMPESEKKEFFKSVSGQEFLKTVQSSEQYGIMKGLNKKEEKAVEEK